MERVYAFTDESGAFGWDLDNPTVSTHFLISAIIVEESKLNEVRQGVEDIAIKYFSGGEIKSSNIGKKVDRRKMVLSETLKLPYSIFALAIDKRLLIDYPGLKYKQSFYKFMNNIVHKELRGQFEKLTIVADEIGGSDYMKSFSSYVKAREDVRTLLGEADFQFENSKNDRVIQLADLISGSLAKEYDNHLCDGVQYHKILEKKITRIEMYPKTIKNYVLNESAIAKDYDKEIAQLCYKKAVDFIETNENSKSEEVKAQLIILKYLLFRFMNNDVRSYIPTNELKRQLEHTSFAGISTQTFRVKIIGALRDSGVIISGSSSKKGYKIPAKEAELFDFINHGTTIIMPMLARLKKCRDIVKLGTANKIDLFDKTEYSSLKKYFDD